MRFFHGETQIGLDGWKAAVQSRSKNHWNEVRSAALLARSWIGAADAPAKVPEPIRRLLGADFPRLTLSDGWVEHKTSPPGKGGASATDLLATGRWSGGGVVLAVEGKVDEGFDHRIACWVRSGTAKGSLANRKNRWTTMAEDLGLPTAGLEAVPYQLLHRTWAALAEARCRGARRAVMLVHSFDPARSGYEDFCDFASRFHPPVPLTQSAPWMISVVDSVEVWVGWAADIGGKPRRTRACTRCEASRSQGERRIR